MGNAAHQYAFEVTETAGAEDDEIHVVVFRAGKYTIYRVAVFEYSLHAAYPQGVGIMFRAGQQVLAVGVESFLGLIHAIGASAHDGDETACRLRQPRR